MGEARMCLSEAASQGLEKLNANVISSALARNQDSPMQLGKGYSCPQVIQTAGKLANSLYQPCRDGTNHLLKATTVFLPPSMQRLVLFGGICNSWFLFQSIFPQIFTWPTPPPHSAEILSPQSSLPQTVVPLIVLVFFFSSMCLLTYMLMHFAVCPTIHTFPAILRRQKIYLSYLLL